MRYINVLLTYLLIFHRRPQLPPRVSTTLVTPLLSGPVYLSNKVNTYTWWERSTAWQWCSSRWEGSRAGSSSRRPRSGHGRWCNRHHIGDAASSHVAASDICSHLLTSRRFVHLQTTRITTRQAQTPLVRFLVDLLYEKLCNKSTMSRCSTTNRKPPASPQQIHNKFELNRVNEISNTNWPLADMYIHATVKLKLHLFDLLWVCCTASCTTNPQQIE